MYNTLNLDDAAQQALGFLTSQTTYIEREVVQMQFPEIQYPALIPVDTSAPEWVRSITYYSSEMTGQAGWLHGYARDIHVADVERGQHEHMVHMADIGYRYSLEELGVAQLTNQPLTTDRAAAARLAYEQFVDGAALRGRPEKGMSGLINYPGVSRVDVRSITEGGNTRTTWDEKTPDEIAEDVNSAITGQYLATNTIELGDTVLLPIDAMMLIATKRLIDTEMTVLSWLMLNNVYTFQTGRPLTFRGVRGLETAGNGGNGRMVVYRRDPQVLKLHIPMTHRFLPVWRRSPLAYDIPGIFRLSGLEVKRLGAVRYVDGITADPDAS